MKSRRYLAAGVSLLALAAMTTPCAAATVQTIHYPFRKGVSFKPIGHVGPYLPPYVSPGKISGTWTDLTHTLPFTHDGPWVALQLTDGTVVEQDGMSSQWYKLTPDIKGKYEGGTWSAIAPMPSGYAPLFFASRILADGRMIVNGGEYNNGSNDWTNLGALYDPVANSWTSVSPPSGWANIGDAQSIILADGTYMLADCCANSQALATISGTSVTWTSTGGQYYNDEEGWSILPNGNLLTVDVWNIGSNYDDYEIYDPGTGAWSLAGKTASLLTQSGKELGPSPMRPDGTIIQFGANTNNNLYNISAGTWSTAAHFPLSGYDCADAPAATLPDGNILVEASPGEFNTPSHFFELKTGRRGKPVIVQVNDPVRAPVTSSFEGTMLVLPTGQVLWGNSQASPHEVATYTPNGSPNPAWLPVISSVATSLTRGSTGNAFSGTNFNGFSLGGVYGDDAQEATNYPLVRITNTGTGDVCFGRSYNFSTMGVWTSGTTNAVFDLPVSCETGAGTLQVIVNGIASAGVAVTLS